uniref:Uncharacterized protein n=1 Tax=Arundo donax TaxID=35708 RepID=A0A0A9AF37_ARUDO
MASGASLIDLPFHGEHVPGLRFFFRQRKQWEKRRRTILAKIFLHHFLSPRWKRRHAEPLFWTRARGGMGTR